MIEREDEFVVWDARRFEDQRERDRQTQHAPLSAMFSPSLYAVPPAAGEHAVLNMVPRLQQQAAGLERELATAHATIDELHRRIAHLAMSNGEAF